MSRFQRRLDLLATALGVRPSEVVEALRRKKVHYCDAQGHILFGRSNSTDDELVDAAFELFIEESPDDQRPMSASV